jgi:hypothetical protein
MNAGRYRDWMETFLNTTCGDSCSKIQTLPIFDLSLSRYNSHHGSFGRWVLGCSCPF